MRAEKACGTRIEVLSGQIERLQAWSDQHRHAHVQALYQAAQEARTARQNLLSYLHEQLQTDVLTAQQQRMARTQVRLFLEQLTPSADPQVQARGLAVRQPCSPAAQAQTAVGSIATVASDSASSPSSR
mgnify:CR=1 FL=1